MALATGHHQPRRRLTRRACSRIRLFQAERLDHVPIATFELVVVVIGQVADSLDPRAERGRGGGPAIIPTRSVSEGLVVARFALGGWWSSLRRAPSVLGLGARQGSTASHTFLFLLSLANASGWNGVMPGEELAQEPRQRRVDRVPGFAEMCQQARLAATLEQPRELLLRAASQFR
jgi:hypothetical protein